MKPRVDLDFFLRGSVCVLTPALCACKLTGLVAWPWWMVTLPLWGCVAAALALILALTCVRVYRAVDADARLALSFAVVAVVMLLFAWRMVWLMRNGVVDSR